MRFKWYVMPTMNAHMPDRLQELKPTLRHGLRAGPRSAKNYAQSSRWPGSRRFCSTFDS